MNSRINKALISNYFLNYILVPTWFLCAKIEAYGYSIFLQLDYTASLSTQHIFIMFSGM